MIKSTLKVTVAIVLLASCKQKPADRTENGLTGQLEKAPSGMVYKITHTNDNEKLIQQGQIAKINLTYTIKSTDSVLQTTVGKMPGYVKFDTAMLKQAKYDFIEIFNKFKKGDKVEFSLSVDTLAKLGAVQINNIFKKGDFIIGKVDVVDIFSSEELAKEDGNKESKILNENQKKPIREYLAKNNIKNAIETPEGVFVVVKTVGDASNKVDSTKQVSVNYKGYHLNGTTFDTNMKPGGTPLLVRIYESNVIYGWHIGLNYFNKGGTGTLYVPSYLAYGEQGAGAEIKPNESIAFDIEVVDVKKKEALPKQSAASPR
jgi:FKBP-type peptidyl-prolyl cis-trans isomerase